MPWKGCLTRGLYDRMTKPSISIRSSHHVPGVEGTMNKWSHSQEEQTLAYVCCCISWKFRYTLALNDCTAATISPS